MKKIVYTSLILLLSLCLFSACGSKDKGNATDDTQTTTDDGNAPVSSLEEPSASPSLDADETQTTAASPSPSNETQGQKTEEESKTETAAQDTTETKKESTSFRTGTAKGYLNGFADSHSVEITQKNGKVITYQVKDDEVLAALSSLEEEEGTLFTFTYTEENGSRTIDAINP